MAGKYQAALEWWLGELKSVHGLSPLLGDNLAEAAAGAADCDALGNRSSGCVLYAAEVPLTGHPGTDLIAGYLPSVFLFSNPLSDRAKPFAEAGGLFGKFARIILPRFARQNIFFYFELDANSGDRRQPSIFFDVPPQMNSSDCDMLGTVLPEFLPAEKAVRCLEGFSLKSVGLMCSRAEKPVRVIVRSRTDCLRRAQALLTDIGGCVIDPELSCSLNELEAAGLMGNVAFDVMPDGSYGKRWGLELHLNCLPAQVQLGLLEDAAVQKLFLRLRQLGAADERLELISRASWDKPDIFAGKAMLSRVSHIKFCWQEGKMLPAKLYLVAEIMSVNEYGNVTEFKF